VKSLPRTTYEVYIILNITIHLLVVVTESRMTDSASEGDRFFSFTVQGAHAGDTGDAGDAGDV
jgi:hypothetical protein